LAPASAGRTACISLLLASDILYLYGIKKEKKKRVLPGKKKLFLFVCLHSVTFEFGPAPDFVKNDCYT
jgi:hypothetical protein